MYDNKTLEGIYNINDAAYIFANNEISAASSFNIKFTNAANSSILFIESPTDSSPFLMHTATEIANFGAYNAWSIGMEIYFTLV